MFPFHGAPRRMKAVLRAFGLATALLVALPLLPGAAPAHEGHDHGPPAPPPAAAAPRVSAHSEGYEVVGVLRGDRLAIYLDRYDTNEPVTNAGLAVTVGADEEVRAELGADGAYVLASPRFSGEGPVELVFAITAPSGDDLLIGTLELPPKAAATPPPQPAPASPLQALRSGGSVRLGPVELGAAPLAAGAALALGFLLGLMVRGGRRLVPVAGLALVALAVSTAYAFAHEGHDHGTPAAVAIVPGDAPRRLPDGAVFLPKPSQRLLEVRTAVARLDEAQRAVTLVGRVIADPNRSGLVQSITGGRIVAPEGGLPRLGQAVRKGDVLALVEQAVPQADRTTISERAGEIEQQIAVVDAKLRRIRGLADRGIAPQSQVIDAEVELEGLKKRREIVRQTRIEPEVLRAPVDGTISAARIVAGQVVGSSDILFQIVDPRSLWVEALVYGETDPAQVTGASASAADGTSLKLAFRGFSRALQQQATVVQFAIETPPTNLGVGQPVRVTAQNGTAVKGIILPRDAVVRGGSGEAVVWRHTDPERFEAKPVRTEPFDATRVVVRAGLGDGERIVIRGAETVNQIR
jgi:RND family efflux transporter MFP subunit